MAAKDVNALALDLHIFNGETIIDRILLVSLSLMAIRCLGASANQAIPIVYDWLKH